MKWLKSGLMFPAKYITLKDDTYIPITDLLTEVNEFRDTLLEWQDSTDCGPIEVHKVNGEIVPEWNNQ